LHGNKSRSGFTKASVWIAHASNLGLVIFGAGLWWKIAGLSGALVWVSFLTAMLVAALTALSYAELGSRFPQWRSRLLRPQGVSH